mmetsp:Transcript_22310/g.34521  ORF Transcript_22310/g.34521 Transcript_22310/m.34521 type:complete len:90 (-) Transcript_22310:3685-3954(-)
MSIFKNSNLKNMVGSTTQDISKQTTFSVERLPSVERISVERANSVEKVKLRMQDSPESLEYPNTQGTPSGGLHHRHKSISMVGTLARKV